MHLRTRFHSFFALVICLAFAGTAWSTEPDETLTLLGQPVHEESATGRLPRHLSQTPENTTVVTAAEIEALNAHTLIDILAAVPGIQIANQIGSANIGFPLIQGSSFNHVQVMLNGIPYNNLSDNVSDIGQIPARIIERVEIVKGAASSTWGQALGGVINVITKSPDPEHRLGGTASASQGERGTIDAGGELSGTLGKAGYYLSGGYLGSAGFRPNTGYNDRNGHARFTLDTPGQGQAGLLFNYASISRGNFAFKDLDLQSSDFAERLIIGGTLRQPLTNQLELQLDAHHGVDITGSDTSLISLNLPLQMIRSDERQSGGGGRLLWRNSGNLLVAGIDYQHVRMANSDANFPVDILRRRADRWGFYLNDTFTVGPLALSAGVRYDLTGTSGEQFSPSFGVTLQLTDTTLLRGYTAKGFSLPSLNLVKGSERVWTSQVGVESSAIPHLWLKGTLFRNDTWDIVSFDSASGTFSTERQIKQGIELEARTAPFFNSSLRAGYSYVDARRSIDDSVVRDLPRNTLHLGISYDDHARFRALLNGRLINWNAEPFRNGRYQGMIWDLHLNATPFQGDLKGAELFFSLHNIFNGSQYIDEVFRNTGRWAEGGVRFRF